MENLMILFIIILVFQFVIFVFCISFMKEIENLYRKIEDMERHEFWKRYMDPFSPINIIRRIDIIRRMNRYN